MKKSELLHQSIATIEETMKKLDCVAEKDESNWKVEAVMGPLLTEAQDYWARAKNTLSHMASLWEKEELRLEQKEKEETFPVVDEESDDDDELDACGLLETIFASL